MELTLRGAGSLPEAEGLARAKKGLGYGRKVDKLLSGRDFDDVLEESFQSQIITLDDFKELDALRHHNSGERVDPQLYKSWLTNLDKRAAALEPLPM